MSEDEPNIFEQGVEGAGSFVDENITGSLAKSVTEPLAEKMDGPMLSAKQARGILPWVGAGVATLIGVAFLQPINWAVKNTFKLVKNIVTGFGLFEKIPLIGGLFSMLGKAIDTIGEYAGFIVPAIAGFIGYKALQSNYKESEPPVDAPEAAAGAAVPGTAAAIAAVRSNAGRGPAQQENLLRNILRHDGDGTPMTEKQASRLRSLLGDDGANKVHRAMFDTDMPEDPAESKLTKGQANRLIDQVEGMKNGLERQAIREGAATLPKSGMARAVLLNNPISRYTGIRWAANKFFPATGGTLEERQSTARKSMLSPEGQAKVQERVASQLIKKIDDVRGRTTPRTPSQPATADTPEPTRTAPTDTPEPTASEQARTPASTDSPEAARSRIPTDTPEGGLDPARERIGFNSRSGAPTAEPPTPMSPETLQNIREQMTRAGVDSPELLQQRNNNAAPTDTPAARIQVDAPEPTTPGTSNNSPQSRLTTGGQSINAGEVLGRTSPAATPTQAPVRTTTPAPTSTPATPAGSPSPAPGNTQTPAAQPSQSTALASNNTQPPPPASSSEPRPTLGARAKGFFTGGAAPGYVGAAGLAAVGGGLMTLTDKKASTTQKAIGGGMMVSGGGAVVSELSGFTRTARSLGVVGAAIATPVSGFNTIQAIRRGDAYEATKQGAYTVGVPMLLTPAAPAGAVLLIGATGADLVENSIEGARAIGAIEEAKALIDSGYVATPQALGAQVAIQARFRNMLQARTAEEALQTAEMWEQDKRWLRDGVITDQHLGLPAFITERSDDGYVGTHIDLRRDEDVEKVRSLLTSLRDHEQKRMEEHNHEILPRFMTIPNWLRWASPGLAMALPSEEQQQKDQKIFEESRDNMKTFERALLELDTYVTREREGIDHYIHTDARMRGLQQVEDSARENGQSVDFTSVFMGDNLVQSLPKVNLNAGRSAALSQ